MYFVVIGGSDVGIFIVFCVCEFDLFVDVIVVVVDVYLNFLICGILYYFFCEVQFWQLFVYCIYVDFEVIGMNFWLDIFVMGIDVNS